MLIKFFFGLECVLYFVVLKSNYYDKFSDLKVGDYVMVDFDGKMWNGEVIDLNHDEKQICVETEVQEFWYEPEHVYPIPINEEQLLRLNFTREVMEDGV